MRRRHLWLMTYIKHTTRNIEKKPLEIVTKRRSSKRPQNDKLQKEIKCAKKYWQKKNTHIDNFMTKSQV